MRTALHWPLPHFGERPRHLAAGLWRLADPKIALASIVPFIAGIAIAYDQRGTIDWQLAIAAFAAIFLVEVGKNAVNDLCDYEADMLVKNDERSPFSGGKRVLVDGLLTGRDLEVIAWIAFGVAALVGIELASRTSAVLLILGMIAAALAVLYAEPPVRLSARGLGELAVFLVYGPGIMAGTILLLGASITLESAIAAIALGLLIANVLLINEIPDENADRTAAKRTLVVRLGRDRAENLIMIVFTAAFVLPLAVATYGVQPFRLASFVVAVPVAALASAMLQRTRSHPPIAAQALTLATYVVAGLAYAAAVLLF